MNRAISSGVPLVLMGDNFTLAGAGLILHGQDAEF
jgi:hypothetical protein